MPAAIPIMQPIIIGIKHTMRNMLGYTYRKKATKPNTPITHTR